MNWIDIACIVFSCVTANHLGLVKAIEEILGFSLPIMNCVKCLTFWVTAGYFCVNETKCGTEAMLAVSFLASYAAIWIELAEGFIDTLYEKCYEKVYSTGGDDTNSAESTESDSAGTVS